MSLPAPQPGLVICYSFLWSHEHRRGQEEGRKDRPCVIVLAVATDAKGSQRYGSRPSPIVRRKTPSSQSRSRFQSNVILGLMPSAPGSCSMNLMNSLGRASISARSRTGRVASIMASCRPGSLPTWSPRRALSGDRARESRRHGADPRSSESSELPRVAIAA